MTTTPPTLKAPAATPPALGGAGPLTMALSGGSLAMALSGGRGPQGERGEPGPAVPEEQLAQVAASVLNAVTFTPGAVAATNTTNLQAAVNQAISESRDLFIKADAPFDQAGTVNVTGPVRIFGAGRDVTTIHQTTLPEAAFYVTGANVRIEDIGFSGNGLAMGSLAALDWQGYCGVRVATGTEGFEARRLRFADIALGVLVRTDPRVEGVAPARCAGFVADDLVADNVWGVLVGGPFYDPQINNIRGSYARVTGTDADSPPHLVYIESTTPTPTGNLDFYTIGGSVTNVLAWDGPATFLGAAVSLKWCKGTAFDNIVARNCRGVLELLGLVDCTLGTVISVDDKYPRDDGAMSSRASISFAECSRTTIESARVVFAAVDHGRALRFESTSSDCLVRSLEVTDASTVDSVATTVPGFAVYVQGTRNAVENVSLTNVGANRWAGVVLSATGSAGRVVNPRVATEGYKYGVQNNSDHLGAVIDYDPVYVKLSRAISGSKKVNVDTPAKPTIRDRSVGQTDPTGFVDEFERGLSVAGLAATDDGKAWFYRDNGGGNIATYWNVDTNAARYNGAGARSLALVDGVSADGTLSTTIATFGNDFGSGLAFRATDSSNYLGLMVNSANGNGQLDLHKRVAGTRTTILQTSLGAVTAGSVIDVVMSGTSVSVKVNGTQVIAPQTVTDFSTGRNHGLLGVSDGKLTSFARVAFTAA